MVAGEILSHILKFQIFLKTPLKILSPLCTTYPLLLVGFFILSLPDQRGGDNHPARSLPLAHPV